MIRIPDPNRLGVLLGNLRVTDGWGRREIARELAAVTGQAEGTWNMRLWAWDTGRSRPEVWTLKPYLRTLAVDLALIPREEP